METSTSLHVDQIHVAANGGDTVLVDKLMDQTSLKEYIQYKCKTVSARVEDEGDAFYVFDLGQLMDVHARWNRALPNIKPFYAVKCNTDAMLLKTLAALGVGFDCSSKKEISSILELGVGPERIIYGHPCKQLSHLQYAAKSGVDLMTFDSEQELYKIKDHFFKARLVLRILPSSEDSQLSKKYGATLPEAKILLHMAFSLNLTVIGVCFHIEDGWMNPSSYQHALELASQVFHYAADVGYHLTLLNIGGGYPGKKNSASTFQNVADCITKGLQSFQEPLPDIIAEPGTFFPCSAFTIATKIISKKSILMEGTTETTTCYYVNDSVYGSFNCSIYAPQSVPVPTLVKDTLSGSEKAIVWGHTCDDVDKIYESAAMPQANIGDWVYFDDMGAYSLSLITSFNGFNKPLVYYYIKESKSAKFEALQANK